MFPRDPFIVENLLNIAIHFRWHPKACYKAGNLHIFISSSLASRGSPHKMAKSSMATRFIWAMDNKLPVLAAWQNWDKTSNNFGHRLNILIRQSPLIYKKEELLLVWEKCNEWISDGYLVPIKWAKTPKSQSAVENLGQNSTISTRHVETSIWHLLFGQWHKISVRQLRTSIQHLFCVVTQNLNQTVENLNLVSTFSVSDAISQSRHSQTFIQHME